MLKPEEDIVNHLEQMAYDCTGYDKIKKKCRNNVDLDWFPLVLNSIKGRSWRDIKLTNKDGIVSVQRDLRRKNSNHTVKHGDFCLWKGVNNHIILEGCL